MKILTTGGAGKIGGYVLRELLQTGHRVTDFGRSAPLVPGVDHVAGDVTDLEQVRAACRGFHAIVHLAAVPPPVGIAPPERLWAVNVTGTFNVLEAAAREEVPQVVHASSGPALRFPFQTPPVPPPYFP